MKLIPEFVGFAYPERPLLWAAPDERELRGLPESLMRARAMGIAARDVRQGNFMPRGLFFAQREIRAYGAYEHAGMEGSSGYGGYFDDARRSTRTRAGYGHDIRADGHGFAHRAYVG
jgi:hypothetical protein